MLEGHFSCIHIIRTAMIIIRRCGFLEGISKMKGKSIRTLRVAVFAAALGWGGAWAQSEDGVYLCGTPEEAGPLGKSADLPKITKVYAGTLKALVIRVSFSDAPYAVPESTINKTNASINTLYNSMSRNTFAWAWSIHPTIFKAPGTRASYAANFSSLQTSITQQMTAAGLKRGTDYDVYVANFPLINVSWAGLSNLRDADWINGTYSAGVTGHELGHSLGLPHAHSIEAGADMFGIPGTTSQTNEYGNPFDIMGRGGSTAHFNALYKWRIGWLDTDEMKEVKTSGVFRLYSQDNALHKNRLIGIRVPSKDPNFAYWFEYRSATASSRTGASVMFQGFKTAANLDSWFLDTTPGSRTSNDEADGVLASGKSFRDNYATTGSPTTFTVLGINTGTYTENGWVDVQVTYNGIPVTLAPLARRHMDSRADGVDLLGRAVDASARILTATTRNGVTRLRWKTR